MTGVDVRLRDAAGRVVDGQLHQGLDRAAIEQAERQWRPELQSLRQRLKDAGTSEARVRAALQHSHWDWLGKRDRAEGLLGYEFVGILAEGRWQGLMALDIATHMAELPPDAGKPLAYVDFLSVAPWNLALPTWGVTPTIRGVGTRLIEWAVRRSVEEGFAGRVGLEALPQAEGFYERLGMTQVRPQQGRRLAYDEFTAAAAVAWLDGGGRT